GGSNQAADWNESVGPQNAGNNSPYYLEFTVTPDSGTGIDFTHLKFDVLAFSTNITTNFAIYADEDSGSGGDNFTTQLNGSDNLPLGSWTQVSVSLSGHSFLQAANQAVTFRIYLWSDGSPWFTCDYIDNIRAKGIPTTTTPPSTDCVSSFATEIFDTVIGPNANTSDPEWNNPNNVLNDDTSDGLNVGRGGRVVVGFGQPFSTSGDSQVDLCITEFSNNDCYFLCLIPADSFTENALISAGANPFGDFYEFPGAPIFCGNENIDFDAFLPGFSEGELSFSQVMFLDDGSSGDGAEFTTFEAKFICSEPQPETATIGDFVFEDSNGNGQQDSGEQGIGGVTVNLLDATSGDVLMTTTTASDGSYSFEVNPGDYIIEFAPGGDLVFSTQNSGNDATDSDANPANGQTDSFTVAAGVDDLTLDAGVVELATIGDCVFEDLNGNGTQDAGEPGVAGVSVVLLDDAGQAVGNDTTDADGKYEFNVVPGTYSVAFSAPTGFQFTAQNVGPDGLDSDADPNTGETAQITVMSGDEIDTIDAGILALGKIGNFVFEDSNGDGVQTPGEGGINGAVVTLLDASGQPAGQSVTTGPDGAYEFCVEPGQYIVSFDLPDGVDFTAAGVGNGALDSDANPANGQSGVITIASGDINHDVDAGGLVAAKLGNFVFEDLNGNGIQDSGEPGVGGVTVVLLDSNGQPTSNTALTDGMGAYQICVVPGTYSLMFQLPTGFEFTIANATTDNNDSDANPANGTTAQVTLESGDVNFDFDAGIIAIAKIGDFVFEDSNGNGQQDSGEDGIAGVLITLLDANGDPTGMTTTSDGDGAYQFCVTPGDYIVAFTAPTGLLFTGANVGNDGSDSDANAGNGQTGVITVASGDFIDNVDAGLIALAKIGDFVFEDLNGNGQQDSGEPGVSGVPVALLNADDLSPTGQTAVTANGLYQFCVEPGAYVVAFGLPTGFQFTSANSAGDAVDSDANPATGMTGPIVVVSGDMNFDVDAGILAIAKIGNFVFEDLNGNGQQDSGEPGVPGVNVVLLSFNGLSISSVMTDASGGYQFCVEPGTYSVVFAAPNGFQFTLANVGGEGSDSDADPNTGATGSITVQSGDINNDVDAGLLTPAKIGDFVFEDLNGNGVQDSDEPGIDNISVQLINTDSGAVVETQQTSGGGAYQFCVLPGTYMVSFSAPTGLNFTTPNVGGEGSDSDADPATGDTAPVTVASGDIVNTVDAGLIEPAKIGDFVFEDLNTNGVQDAGDIGVGGVFVQLLDENGQPTGDFVFTEADGSYEFCVQPGSYGINVVAPSGFRFTINNNNGVDDTLDSDVNPATGDSNLITVDSGEINGTLDAGLVELPNPNDFMYPDTICNFTQGSISLPTNPQDALGSQDGQVVTITDGGCISVRAACNNFANSGDGSADLSVCEIGDVDDYTVGVRPADPMTEAALIGAGFDDADGNGYYEVVTLFGAATIDLDELIPGFAAGDLLFSQVKVSDIAGGPNGFADIDSIGFGLLSPISNDVDPADILVADYARIVRDFIPGTSTLPASNNIANVVGLTDGVALTLGEGGKLRIGMLGAWFSNSGTAEADVYVFENDEDEGYFIELCPADAFTTQALISAGFADTSGNGCYLVYTDACPGDLAFDIDACLPGYEKGQLLFDELVICDDNLAPDTTPASGADIDAVAFTTHALPGNVPTSDFLFEAGLNGAPKAECPAVQDVSPGDVLEIEVTSPSGVYSDLPYVVAIMCVPTGQPITPPMAFPGLWLNPDRAPVFLLFEVPGMVAQGSCIPIPIPAGVEGFCCTIQALGLGSSAPNGFFVSSNAFEVCSE
ncbi:MAG: SdrD B-like domain-containing protein, partial [Planctomycetota bacterium]